MLFSFMLRNFKCKSTVEIVMRNESNVLSCNGNRFCLIAVKTVEITFVNWFYNLWDFKDNVELYELINLNGSLVLYFFCWCWVSKLLSKLVSLMKLYVLKCETPYLPDGYTVTSNVHVYSWIYDNFLWI